MGREEDRPFRDVAWAKASAQAMQEHEAELHSFFARDDSAKVRQMLEQSLSRQSFRDGGGASMEMHKAVSKDAIAAVTHLPQWKSLERLWEDDKDWDQELEDLDDLASKVCRDRNMIQENVAAHAHTAVHNMALWLPHHFDDNTNVKGICNPHAADSLTNVMGEGAMKRLEHVDQEIQQTQKERHDFNRRTAILRRSLSPTSAKAALVTSFVDGHIHVDDLSTVERNFAMGVQDYAQDLSPKSADDKSDKPASLLPPSFSHKKDTLHFSEVEAFEFLKTINGKSNITSVASLISETKGFVDAMPWWRKAEHPSPSKKEKNKHARMLAQMQAHAEKEEAAAAAAARQKGVPMPRSILQRGTGLRRVGSTGDINIAAGSGVAAVRSIM